MEIGLGSIYLMLLSPLLIFVLLVFVLLILYLSSSRSWLAAMRSSTFQQIDGGMESMGEARHGLRHGPLSL